MITAFHITSQMKYHTFSVTKTYPLSRPSAFDTPLKSFEVFITRGNLFTSHHS